MPNFGLLKKYNFGNKLIYVILGTIVALSITILIGTNALATHGVVLQQILVQTEKINKENQILNIELGKQANLSYIQTRASSLGFVRARSSLIILPEDTLAAAR